METTKKPIAEEIQINLKATSSFSPVEYVSFSKDTATVTKILYENARLFPQTQLLSMIVDFFNPATIFSPVEILQRKSKLAYYLIRQQPISEKTSDQITDELFLENAQFLLQQKLALFTEEQLKEKITQFLCMVPEELTLKLIHFLTLHELEAKSTQAQDRYTLESQQTQEIPGIKREKKNLTCQTCGYTFEKELDYDIHQFNKESIECDYHQDTNCLEELMKQGRKLEEITYNQVLELRICSECFNFYWG